MALKRLVVGIRKGRKKFGVRLRSRSWKRKLRSISKGRFLKWLLGVWFNGWLGRLLMFRVVGLELHI